MKRYKIAVGLLLATATGIGWMESRSPQPPPSPAVTAHPDTARTRLIRHLERELLEARRSSRSAEVQSLLRLLETI